MSKKFSYGRSVGENMGASVQIAKRTPMPVKHAVRSLRHARRAAFEAAGSDRYSAVAAGGMDRALAELVGRDGVFLEAGANDGVRYSNTYLLERFYGWHGVLVEPLPSLAAKAAKQRPHSRVFACALSEPDAPPTVALSNRDLVSRIADHGTIVAPARTLSDILDEARIDHLDLLSLDVEGHEEKALAGLDLDRCAPAWLLVELWGADEGRRDRFERDALRGRYVLDRRLSGLDFLYRLATP